MDARVRCLLGGWVLAALAACGGDEAASTAAAPAADDTKAAPVASAEIKRNVAESMPVASLVMPYVEARDDLTSGYFAFPEGMDEPLPAILLIHDWWGLDAEVRSLAERLAGQGYMVLAIDLFHGATAGDVREAADLSRQLLEETELAEANIAAGYRFLTDVAGAPSVAALGRAMGGFWALKSTWLLPGELDAAVVYYGQLDVDDTQLAAIDAPILGLYGGDDRAIQPEAVRRFRQSAEDLGKRVETQIYPGVKAGFANPSDPRFDQQAADDAWERTLSFLQQYLR